MQTRIPPVICIAPVRPHADERDSERDPRQPDRQRIDAVGNVLGSCVEHGGLDVLPFLAVVGPVMETDRRLRAS